MADVSLTTLMLLTAVSVPFILMPGPNVLVIIATTMSHGRGRGATTVAGTSTAMILQLMIAAVGTTALVAQLQNGLIWIRWAGVFYLLVMGLSALKRLISSQPPSPLSGTGSFRRGFLVSLTNPKTILFFSAFLPQFVNPDGSYGQQIAVLSAWFWLLASLLDLSYVMTVHLLRKVLHTWHTPRVEDGLSAAVYLGASGLLALSGKN